MNLMIKNPQKYCESMSQSSADKLFFLHELNISDYDVIVDIGCADGTLISQMAENIESSKQILFIGIDKDKRLVNAGLNKSYNNKSVLLFNLDLEEDLLDEEKEEAYAIRQYCQSATNMLLVCSSVLHEFNFLSSPFFSSLCLLANTIVVRDMKAPVIQGPIDGTTRARVIQNFPKELLVPFEEKFGRIDNTRTLYRFFLMYKWKEDWAKELEEDYFSIKWQDLKEWLSNLNFHVAYEKDYILPYIKKEIMNRFSHKMRQPTHKQIIFDRN